MTSSGSCHLLGGLFAEGVQAALAVIALLSLIVKWRLESPRRQLMVWLMDVSKQAGSGIFAHCLNILAAELLSLDSSVQDQVRVPRRYARGSHAGKWLCRSPRLTLRLPHPPPWTPISAHGTSSTLHWTRRWAWAWRGQRSNWCSVWRRGVAVPVLPAAETTRAAAGESLQPPTCTPRILADATHPTARPACACSTWVAQLLAWLGITLVVKLVVISVILLAKRPFTHLSNDISDVFQGHPKLELVAVMIACPCIMNVVQFWVRCNSVEPPLPRQLTSVACPCAQVQDAFLKHPSKRGDGVLLASTTSRSTGSSRASPASHSSCSGSGLSDPMLPSASRPIERGACSRGDSSLQADDAVATSVAIASCASHAPTTQYGAVDGDADAYAATMSGASVAIAVDRERF